MEFIMRKVLVLLAILVMPFTLMKAQDKTAQSPIIAIAEGKLYSVSADDGAATLLADTADDQSIAPLRFSSLSPDGKQFVYISASDFNTTNEYQVELFLVTLAD